MAFFSLLSAAPTPVPISQILSDGGEVVTNMLGWVGNIANMIASNGLLFLVTGIMIAGACVGLFGRLLSRG